MKLRVRVHEWKYWHIDRKTRKFIPFVARHLPKKLQYFVIVAVAVQVEKNESPAGVTAEQMLKHLGA